MRILIVEDDYDTRLLLESLVEHMGQTDSVINGTQAVRTFQLGHTNDSPYDLVLLDIMLPEMNGREVLRQIRRLEDNMELSRADRVNVIMVSALDDANNVMGAFQEGCEAYITKPFRKEQLIQEIKKLGL